MEETEYMFMYTKYTVLCHDMYIADKDLKDPTKIKKAWFFRIINTYFCRKKLLFVTY